MKNSIQREVVLNIVNSSFSHPTAEEIYFEARKEIDNISLGTVYRNLNYLVEAKEITRIKSKGSTYRYDNSFKKHAHFVCKNCGMITDVSHNIVENIQEFDGSIVLDYELTFDGICKECLKKGGY